MQSKPRYAWLPIALLLLAALGLRLSILGTSKMISERQYRSALLARGYYLRSTDSVPEWRTRLSEIRQERIDVVEPPIMEFLVAFIYLIAHNESLWIAQSLSALFWTIGGVFLYHLAKRMVSVEAALLGTAYYLFVPLGVVISISFLPEPLMMATFLLSLLTIVRYHEKPSIRKCHR